MITAKQLRQKYIDFFVTRGHKQIPGSSLVPENDPSVLFTTAGMFQLVPYLLGQPHPEGKRLVDLQKCLRTDDIDEVGDAFHHTFFEMLGNWSLGDYFKQESISWSFEFLTEELGLNKDRLYVSCFAGDNDAPKDEESAGIWKSLGIPEDRIFFYPKKDNWWGPVGQTGPCGPDTEMFYDVTRKSHGPDCRPGCFCGRFSEIWNNVFMEYNKTAEGKFEKLSKPNVDTGMGVDRTLAVASELTDNYETELWVPAIEKISKLSGKDYETNKRVFRIIADHVRASIFAIAEGIIPSNKEKGYVLRRLIRRATFKVKQLDINPEESAIFEVADIFVKIMSDQYPEIESTKMEAKKVLGEEINKFNITLERGLEEFNKVSSYQSPDLLAFNLFQSYGFPFEITEELLKQRGKSIDGLRTRFDYIYREHQELSRTASAGMFKGGLADRSEVATKYHSATHLLHAALRRVLGEQVHQEGSNITGERLRFDFSYSQKLTENEVKKVEDLVNEEIVKDLPRRMETMTYEDAIKSGALAFFKERYPEKVTVYSFGDFSKEICGGPHVESTGQIGRFQIVKTEKIAAGTQRIYAKIEEAGR